MYVGIQVILILILGALFFVKRIQSRVALLIIAGLLFALFFATGFGRDVSGWLGDLIDGIGQAQVVNDGN